MPRASYAAFSRQRVVQSGVVAGEGEAGRPAHIAPLTSLRAFAALIVIAFHGKR